MCERALSAYVSRPPPPSHLAASRSLRFPWSPSLVRLFPGQPILPSTGNATDYATSCAASFLCHRDLPREPSRSFEAALSYREVFPTFGWNAVEWGGGNGRELLQPSINSIASMFRNTEDRIEFGSGIKNSSNFSFKEKRLKFIYVLYLERFISIKFMFE